MSFELSHTLRGLDERTATFLTLEAITTFDEEREEPRDVAARVLKSRGDAKVTALLKEMLRLL